MQLRLTKTFGLLAVLAYAGTASADVIVSGSNNASAGFGNELTQLLGQDHVSLQRVAPTQVKKLQTVPTAGKAATELAFDKSYLAGLPKAAGGAEWQCMSQALYFEARGESVKGQFAVAEVIMNRVKSGDFPDTVCGVINQGTGRKFQCQFTYTCDGLKESINEPRAWTRVGKIAKIVLDGDVADLTQGATHYHTKAVHPRWSKVFPLTATIGVHRFYRMPTRTASNG